MKKMFLFIFCILLAAICFAQKNDSLANNLYIEKHQNEFGLKLALTNNTEFFDVRLDSRELILKPNTQLKTKLFFSYRFILFAIGFSPEFLPGNNDDNKKGKSDIFWFGSKMNLKHWTQKIDYTTTKGYYLENTGDYQADWIPGKDEYIQFPDLKYWAISGYTAYKFNENLSFSAIETQTERQLKSAGSFAPALVYKYYVVDDQTPLTGQNSSQKSNNLEINLQLGYIYTHVINRSFYISGGASAGGGIIHNKIQTRYYGDNYIDKMNHPIFRMQAAAALGYNSKRFFAGAQFLGSLEEYAQDKSSTNVVVKDSFTFQIFAGYRLNAPKSIVKFFDKMPF